MNMKIVLLLVHLCTNEFGESARILAVFLYPSYSHQIFHQAVWNELASRGHQVIVFTPNPQENQTKNNLREIDISFMYEFRKVKFDVANLDGIASGKEFYNTYFKQVSVLSEKIFQHPEMQALLTKSDLTFDLILVDLIHPVMVALSIKFNCPFAGILSLEIQDTINKDIGNYYNPVVYPNYFFPVYENLSFWDRLKSTYFSIWHSFFFENEIYSKCDDLIRKYLGHDYPGVKQIMGNFSVIIVNSNPLFTKPRPNIPKIINVSGLHIKTPKPLPKNIKEYLDDAHDGAIYFSLGSNIRSTALTAEIKLIFLETIRELPYKVLWKFEESNFTNMPSNLKIEKWLPQEDILSHPNVKVFITQGGLQSIEEAVRKRVPLVGVPFFCDQFKNMHKIMQIGFGKMLDKSSLTKESFKNAVIEVAENQKYRKKVEELAILLEDEQVKPLDKAMWWIEYVIRHKGCTHIRNPLLDMSLYQYHLLDIAAFCILVSFITMLTAYHTIKYVVNLTIIGNRFNKLE